MKRITPLFPVPVFSNTLDRDLTSTELGYINEQEKDLRTNAGNFSSKNVNVLESKELSDIKKFCLDNINMYFEELICTKNNVVPYITISWINFTYGKGFHHKHWHPNSILSGVFYIHTSPNDRIHFHKSTTEPIKFDIEKYHEFNSGVWWIPAEKNTLLLFPSTLWHEVINRDSEDTRISLSFNVFVKGHIGNIDELNTLEF